MTSLRANFEKNAQLRAHKILKGGLQISIARPDRQRILSHDSTWVNYVTKHFLVCIYLNTGNMRHTYDRHPLAYVVEVKNGEQTVGDGSAHLCGGNGSRSTRAKHKAKVSGCSHKSAFIWRLSLVNQLALRETDVKPTVIRPIFVILEASAASSHSPSLFSSLMTVWQSDRRRKNSCVWSSPTFTDSSRVSS